MQVPPLPAALSAAAAASELPAPVSDLQQLHQQVTHEHFQHEHQICGQHGT